MVIVRLVGLFLLLQFLSNCTCSRQTVKESGKEAATATASVTPDPNKAPDYSGITVEKVITKDLEIGKGEEIKEGSKVSGFYGMWVYAPAQVGNKGKFISGTDKESGRPFQLTVGKGEVVKGFEQGLIGMRPGGKRQIIVPVSLAYGEKGTEDVPPGSILLIEFEVAKAK